MAEGPAARAPRGRASRRALFTALALAGVAALFAAGFVALRAHDASSTPGERDWSAEAAKDPSETIAGIRRHLERRPGDLRAWLILGRLQYAAGDYPGSVAAYAQALRDDGRLATKAELWAEYADALAMNAGGKFRGEPARALERALALNPRDRKALELAGTAALEAGDYTGTLEHWSALLALLAPGSPEQAQLLSAIERVEARSGVMRPSGR